MSRYLDFLNENQQFQNYLQFGTQEKESYDERKDQALLGIAQISPIIPDVISKGKEAYNKSIELYEKGKEVIDKIKQGAKKTADALEEGGEKLKTVGEKGVKLIEDTSDKAQKFAKKVEEGINISKSEIENLTEKYGERFTTQFKDVQKKAVDFGTDLVKQNREKLQAIKDEFDQKRQELGRPLTEEERKPFEDSMKALKEEKEEFGKRFIQYREQLEKDLKNQFTEKTQTPPETPKVEIKPSEEMALKRRPTQFTRAGEEEDQSFIRRRTQQMAKRVAQEDFERDDVGDIAVKNPTIMDRLTSVFRGGVTDKRINNYSDDELQGLKDEFDRLKGGARSEGAEARFQELKSTLDKYGSNASETAEKVGTDISNNVKGSVKGIQSTANETLDNTKESINNGVQKGKEFLQDTAKGLQTTGRETLNEGVDVAKGFVSKSTELAGEGADIAKQTASKAIGLASEGSQIASETLSTIGGIAGEVLGPVGELANLGLGLYDIIKSFGDKPHIYNEARPVFTAGL